MTISDIGYLLLALLGVVGCYGACFIAGGLIGKYLWPDGDTDEEKMMMTWRECLTEFEKSIKEAEAKLQQRLKQLK